MRATTKRRTKRQTLQEWEAALRLDVQQQRAIASNQYRWEHAVVDYLEQMPSSTNKRHTIYSLRRLDAFLKGWLLGDIGRGRIAEIQKSLAAMRLQNATINRIVSIIIAILNKGVAWDWIDRVPKVARLPEGPLRDRSLDRPSAERLIRELPPHLRVMAIFALETGLRRSNVTLMRWDWIDIAQNVLVVPAESAKGKVRSIPTVLTPLARAVLDKMQGEHPEYVFTYKGKPVTQTATRAWRKALQRAGITNFRWHDLRHTWASWHAQGGTPEMFLQQLGGWRSQKMVARYSHLNVEHMRPFVEKHQGLPEDVLRLLDKKDSDGTARGTP